MQDVMRAKVTEDQRDLKWQRPLKMV